MPRQARQWTQFIRQSLRPTGRSIFFWGALAENSNTYADIILRTPSGIPVLTRKSDLSASSFPYCCVDTCIRVLLDGGIFYTSFLGSFRFLLTFVMRLFLVSICSRARCLPRQWIHVLRHFYTKAGLRFQSAVRTLDLLIGFYGLYLTVNLHEEFKQVIRTGCFRELSSLESRSPARAQ